MAIMPGIAVGKAARLAFIDNVRWAMIVLVIFHHAAVTYSHVGGWFYFEGRAPSLPITLLLATFLSFNQAFFMGLLFLLAGYFVEPSFDQKGFARFSRDRFYRLGLPSLLFMLVIYPLIVYWMMRRFYQPKRPSLLEAYGPFIISGRVLSASGPMWFAVALLLFCLVYGGFRSTFKRGEKPGTANPQGKLPGHWDVIRFALFVAAGTFVVRIFQPVGSSVRNMQLCYFVQYIALFCVGILAYRRNWLVRIPYAFGTQWLRLALSAGVLVWVGVLLSSGVLRGEPPTRILGGLHWQSALNCVWESFVCMGMCLGVLVLFRDRFRFGESFSRFMGRNAFAAYVFHTPLLIAVTLSVGGWTAPVLLKVVVAGAIATVVTFLACEFVFRRTPLLRSIL